MVAAGRLVKVGAVPSTGTVGDGFDNAMAEADVAAPGLDYRYTGSDVPDLAVIHSDR